MSDFKKKLDKIKKEGKGKVAKGFFGLTFDGIRNNKDSIEKKALSSRKRKRVIIIYQRCIIYKRPTYKKLKAYYYPFLKIVPKGGTPSARTQKTANYNLKKNYIKEKLMEIKNKRARTA